MREILTVDEANRLIKKFEAIAFEELKRSHPTHEFSTFETSGGVLFYQAKQGLQDISDTQVERLRLKLGEATK